MTNNLIQSKESALGQKQRGKKYYARLISRKILNYLGLIIVNNGERVKFYVENNHEGIISSEKYALVQEELARRTSKPKIKQKGTKTEQGKYSSKYALTELLVCGECKTPYRRCTWTMKGQKKIVWRCINRLDYGKKYGRVSSENKLRLFEYGGPQ